MKTSTKAFIISICLFLAGIMFGVLTELSKPHVALGAGSANTLINAFSDSRGVLVASTTSTLLLATSSSRQYAYIVNMSPTAEIFLSLTGGGAATANTGIRVGPNGTYEIRDVNLYTGAIYAIASSSPASTTVAAKQ